MQQISIYHQNSIQQCLLAVVAFAMLPTLCEAQDSWLYAWRNQPSGEFAPDHRKVDPFQPMFSDADLELQAARTAPSFLTQFTSNVKTSALQDSDAGSIADVPTVDALIGDEPAEYETDPAMSPAQHSASGSGGYAPLDVLMPQTATDLPITPQQVFSNKPAQCSNCDCWQVLPQGLMYNSYIAGEKEPRMQFIQLHDTRSKRRVWDAVLGGRLGLLRYGNCDSVNPQGFQLDVEGAVFARVLPDELSAMLEGSDYRAGLLGTNRFNRTAVKYGYYHVSSHIGDEFLLDNPTFERINYVRDSVIVGVTQDLKYSTQVYGEMAYALGAEGGAKPLEFQFGTQYLPVAKSSLRGAPYVAANYHIREDFQFQGGFNTVAGWGWQGLQTRHRLRVGLQYYNGPSLQYQFLNRVENLYGGGIWFDY
ncbi:MAG: DUF1207 domain-containing protein [Planctomycetaceae bacterium]